MLSPPDTLLHLAELGRANVPLLVMPLGTHFVLPKHRLNSPKCKTDILESDVDCASRGWAIDIDGFGGLTWVLDAIAKSVFIVFTFRPVSVTKTGGVCDQLINIKHRGCVSRSAAGQISKLSERIRSGLFGDETYEALLWLHLAQRR